MVIGIACLLLGGVTGLKNSVEAGLAFLGPDRLEQMMAMMQEMDQPLSDQQRQEFETQIRALSKPVYRIGSAIESVLTVVMSLVLIVAGIGLLRDRIGALKLTRWWAYYTIPAAVVSVLLSFNYVLPEMPNAPSGSGAGGTLYAGLMLLTLWAFPVIVLRHLPTTQVKTYLAARQQGQASHPATMDIATPPASTQARRTDARQGSDAASPSASTWRDDPWNDNTSQ